MAEWFYRVMGEEIGPVTTNELRQRANSGQLLPETEVRKSGTDRWVRASQLKGLFDEPTPEHDASDDEAVLVESGRPTQASEIIVTTCDLKQDYEVIFPIYFQISNKGIFSSKLKKLAKHYRSELSHRESGDSGPSMGALVDGLIGPASVGDANFETAFYISILEMRRIAAAVGADAVIGVRQDTDLDTTGFQFFYMQMYGTAVKLIR
ncbi:GYF domain-containing protein [Mariniblastus sp.]|nr:GYF domain-containing protein [Mariniblastus sp.]